jgi:hypothetical protein
MPEGQGQGQGQGDGQQGAGQSSGATFESWDAFLGAQPEDVKALYTTHVTGLQNAVKATRQERDDFAKQVKDLLPKAEKGSELEKSLLDFTSKLEVAERRAIFAEEAARPEIGCTNPKLAWTLAQSEGLFDRKGAPDWEAIKGAAPELFRKPGAAGNAGAGTGGSGNGKLDMNQMLRNAAGRP